jgi:hypothetical protein
VHLIIAHADVGICTGYAAQKAGQEAPAPNDPVWQHRGYRGRQWLQQRGGQRRWRGRPADRASGWSRRIRLGGNSPLPFPLEHADTATQPHGHTRITATRPNNPTSTQPHNPHTTHTQPHNHIALTLTLAHSNTTTCHNCALVNGPQAPPDCNVNQYQPHWVKILVWCHCTIEYWGGGPGLFYLLEYYYHLVTLTLTLRRSTHCYNPNPNPNPNLVLCVPLWCHCVCH